MGSAMKRKMRHHIAHIWAVKAIGMSAGTSTVLPRYPGGAPHDMQCKIFMRRLRWYV